MKIIVLGATGQIGSIIYKGLQGTHEVIGTSRNKRPGMMKFDPFRDDWSHLGKAQVLVNCIGQIEATKTSSFEHIHVNLTKLIIQNRGAVGASKIIQISALGASENHHISFLRTKGIADKLLLSHPGTVVIRPSIVCTHRTMIIKKMLMLSKIGSFTLGIFPIPSGFLKTKIQPVMPKDLGALVDKICFSVTEQIINAVGPESISFGELIDIMNKTRNQSLKLIEVSRMLFDILVKAFADPMFPTIINWQQYRLLFEDNVADAKSIENILGRRPTSTKEFFKNEFANAEH